MGSSQAKKVSEFLTQLWDLGLELGHNVLGLDDISSACGEEITVATSLFEIRHLAVPKSHADIVLNRLYGDNIWNSEDFFRAHVHFWH